MENFLTMERVTPEELWRAVGELLLVHRTRKQWNAVDVERHGGPSLKTVQSIELGEVGRVDVLARHAEALGLSIVDVLRAVLAPPVGPQLTPEAAAMLRRFEGLGVENREILRRLAQQLALAEEAVAAAAAPAPAPQTSAPRKK